MKLLSHIFPHPQLTLLLTAVWMLLANSLSLNSLLFGLFLGIVIPAITRPYWPNRPQLRNWPMIAEYLLVVLWDIVMANIAVARIILFKRDADRQPVWICVPLDLRSPEAITVLAGTITMTPGTLTADLSAKGHNLLVHCLDAPDPDAVRDEIKNRYERRLKEIFE
ncbi:multisubunit potassium/proton antiporter, PhaE subunit [Cribrihabitans marinus]|uniref:Multisubunit potassium/proton antiporter, PhaE subunit n=1 Tax=Cribrihabitans marinus TaxID=1227549 RepID=A0A1H7BAE4_9RHOB|nr:Na+/H+ antiporter subunit E [Cribrihabitans marinus]GGH32764.1 Na+/H+ antiporter subunit E [Cribrihabitans marinus]SEJ70365.1 multisubunit potassium/proton antiporter, PhaE subunit [Cribrihabitans marinus]